MLKQLQYKILDGKTPLSAGELNPRLFDIDARLHALETLRVSWQAAVDEVTNHGLTRINEVVKPTLEAAEAIVAELNAELAQIRAEWADVTTAWALIEPRVADAETRLAAIEADIATMGGTLTSHGTRLDGAETRLDSAETRLTSAEGRLTTVEGGLANLPPQTHILRFALMGTLQVGNVWLRLPVGVAGHLVRAGAKIDSGTTATVRFCLNNSGIYNCVATTSGAATNLTNNVSEFSTIRIDITSISGAPVNVSGFVIIEEAS